MNVSSRADSAFSSIVTSQNAGILPCDPVMVNYGLHASWITPNALYGIHQVGTPMSTAAGILTSSLTCPQPEKTAPRPVRNVCLQFIDVIYYYNYNFQEQPDSSQAPCSSASAATTSNAATPSDSGKRFLVLTIVYLVLLS